MTSEMMPCPLCKSHVGGFMKEVLKYCAHCGGINGWHQEDCARRAEQMEAWIDCAFDLGTHRRPAEPASTTLSEIVAAAEAWVEAERTIFHAGSEREADEAAHGITAARSAFLALVAAHEAEVAKVLAPFAELGDPFMKDGSSDDSIWVSAADAMEIYFGRPKLPGWKLTVGDLRAAADLRRRVTAAPHEKREG